MRDDLIDAYAGVEWANAQLPILQSRIESWQQLPPYKIVEEMEPKGHGKIYKLGSVLPLPAVVNAEAGLIINSLRSSLDVLANVLAFRNTKTEPKGTHFPICATESAFREGKNAGRKAIKLLADADRKVIEELQPWAGGHPYLFDLHTWDVVRKHKRLIGAYIHPKSVSVGNIDRHSEFRIPGQWGGLKDGTNIGRAKIDAPKPDIHIALTVCLGEGTSFPYHPLLQILHEYASATAAIIDRFRLPLAPRTQGAPPAVPA